MAKQIIEFVDMSGEDKKNLVKNCQKLKKAAAAFRREAEQQLIQNAAFFAGDQYSEFVSDARTYTNNRRVPIYAPGTKTRLVANKILGICWQQASYLNQNFSEEIAEPTDNSPDSVMRAEIATDVLRSRFHTNREEEQRIFDLLWLFVSGRIWKMVFHDPKASYKGFDGRDVYGIGDTVKKRLNPFTVYQSPWVDSTGEMPWLIISEAVPLDQAKELFGASADNIKEIEVAESVGRMDSLLQSTVQGTAAPPKRAKATIIDILYHRPTPDYPEGSTIAWCGDEALDRQTLPEKRWCFQHTDWTPMPGANNPLAYIQPMVGPQKQLNFTLSQIRDLAGRQLNPPLAYRGQKPDEGVGISPVDYCEDENTGSRYIRIDPTVTEYEFITYDFSAGLGKEVIAMMSDTLLDVGSIHDQSMGKQVSQDVTATTTLALKESDMAGTSLHRDIIAKANCRASEMELYVLSKHVTMPRPLPIVDKDGKPQQMIFTGADIEGINKVSVVSLPMMTDAQRRETIDRLETSNAFGPFQFEPTDLRYWESLLRGAEMALKSGLPNIETYVENRIKPFSIEGLRNFVSDARVQAVEMILNPPQPEPAPMIPGMPMGAGQGPMMGGQA